ncbi:MAG: hypothetical protein HYY17_01025 [Planctomycetes bacterium]|nr:hypothetical protein [Planctomycetota bacterium]
MTRALILGAIAAGLTTFAAAAPAGEGPTWASSWAAGKAQAAASGRPILVLSFTDKKGGGC